MNGPIVRTANPPMKMTGPHNAVRLAEVSLDCYSWEQTARELQDRVRHLEQELEACYRYKDDGGA